MSTPRYIRLTAVSAALFLAACGGSDSNNTEENVVQTYTVAANAGTGGSISPLSRTVESGSTTTFSISADTGYNIDTVSGCGGSLNNNTYTTGAITAACTVEASFELISYTVTATAGEGGSINPESTEVDHGSDASFTVSPKAGYGIDTVIGCDGSLSGDVYTTAAITQNCDIEASFNVTLVPPQNLTATAGNEEITLTWEMVEEADGYHLYYATESGINPANYASFDNSKWVQNITSPHTISNLENDIEYFAVVTAFVGDLESDASNEVAATPFEPVPDYTIRVLNDTGIDWCADDVANNLECPVESYRGQDGEHGRDASARDGNLQKVGGGNASFDFTKLDENGEVLAATATEWSCVRDNHTGLIWEVKTTDGGLRDKANIYSWYNPDSASNGGNPGHQRSNRELCSGFDCNSYSFVQHVNAEGLCGANDWRVPTRKELMSLVDNGRARPSIDITYFPNTQSVYYRDYYWSYSPAAQDSEDAWAISFDRGDALSPLKFLAYHLRLVRTVQ